MPSKPALEKRVSSRKKMVVPVKSHRANTAPKPVHTLDLSRSGAKLGAFREPVNCGDILVVQRQHKRAKCRVVWVRDMGRGEIHVGVELVQPDSEFWGVSLDDSVSVVCTPAN